MESTLNMLEGGLRVLQFFQKTFRSPEPLDLNISWPINFFGKYFMASPINFNSLFMAFL